jgi:uncharacterized protein
VYGAVCCAAKSRILSGAFAGPRLPFAVKFQPDHLAGTNAVTRHDPGALWVGNQRFDRSVLVPWRGDVKPWAPATVEQLSKEDFEAVLALKPELVIFGSGPRLRFVSPALLRSLIDAGIGVETMDTAAACRTYNVLVAEGRSAVAALLVAPAA